jgi:hypothetical protein
MLFCFWNTRGKWRKVMAKSRNNLSDVINGTYKSRSARQTAKTDLVTQSQSSRLTEKTMTPGSSKNAKLLTIDAHVMPTSIHFGSPSSTKTASSESGSEWSNLLKQTVSGGVASVLGGGMGIIGGLGSVVSGLVSWFGGGSKSSPPPLVRFQLPASEEQTVYAGTKGSTVYEGSAVESTSASGSTSGIYSASPAPSTSGMSAVSSQYQNSQIIQAVKNALLNSSSLNDVIAEI